MAANPLACMDGLCWWGKWCLCEEVQCTSPDSADFDHHINYGWLKSISQFFVSVGVNVSHTHCAAPMPCHKLSKNSRINILMGTMRKL